MVRLGQADRVRHSFGLTPGARPFGVLGAHSTQSGRRFVDYTVGGRPLHELLSESDRGLLAEDLIPALVYDWSPDDDIDVLLGVRPSELEDGRVPLYRCPECGDLGCGTISVVIERGPGAVRWREFGYQTDYEPFDDDSRLTDVGPFEFDRVEYEAAFAEFRAGWPIRAAQRATEAKAEQIPRRRRRFRIFRGGRAAD